MEQKTTGEIYQVICLCCGMPLKQTEIATQFSGQTIDFDERVAMSGTAYYFCRECSDRAKSYLTGGMEKAIKRRNDLRTEIQSIDLSGVPPDHIAGV